MVLNLRVKNVVRLARQGTLTMALGLTLLGGHAIAAEPEPKGPPSGHHVSHVDQEEMRMLDQLRSGGYVLLFRHAFTDANQLEDVKPFDLSNCYGQRMLSTAGRLMSEEIGILIGRMRVPVGDVVASPMCRTVETGKLMFTRAVADERLIGAREMDSTTRRANLVAVVRKHFKPNTNLIVVAHHHLPETLGIRLDEGDALVLKPNGDNLETVRTIPVGRWGDIYRTYLRKEAAGR